MSSRRGIDPTMENRELDQLDEANFLDMITLPGLQIDADSSGTFYNFEDFPGMDYSQLDYSQLEEDIRTDSDDIFLFGDVGATGYSVTNKTTGFSSGQEIAADEEKAKKKEQQKKEDEKRTKPRRRSTNPGGPKITIPGMPNTSVGLGPFIGAGALLSINNNDDDETEIPITFPPKEKKEPPPPPPPPPPKPNMATRLIPSTQTGTLPELTDFMGAYTPAATDIVGDMAGLAGAGFDAFARNQLGMGGDGQINRFDVARETARQQTGALGEASGAGADASYTEMINAFADPLKGVEQMRGTLSDVGTLRQQEMARLDQGLSGRQRRDAIEAGRSATGQRRGNLEQIEEVFSLVGADEGLRGQRMQNILGLGELTGDLATRESYALSPFTGAAVQAADLTPGFGLAGEMSRQASAATPSAMELFGLEAGERQFGLDQKALDVAEKTGNIRNVADALGLFINRPINEFEGLGEDFRFIG